MAIKMIKTDEVKTAGYNPRKISDEELKKLEESIKKYGCVRPLVINKRSGILVSGHQTLKAAINLDIKELSYITVDLDEKNEKALNLALNKIQGEFDMEKLQTLFDELDIDEITGFTDEEIKEIVDIKEFERGMEGQDFTDIIDKFESDEKNKPRSKKDERWFYVEFYGQDRKYKRMLKLLEGCFDGINTKRRLSAAAFEKIVEAYFKGKGE